MRISAFVIIPTSFPFLATSTALQSLIMAVTEDMGVDSVTTG